MWELGSIHTDPSRSGGWPTRRSGITTLASRFDNHFSRECAGIATKTETETETKKETEMPRMSEINVQKSNYFKVKDLEEATGKPWGQSNFVVTVVKAWIDEYPAENGKDPEPAYLLELAGFAKPFGCNLTNRKTIEGIVGDVEWDTGALGGLTLQMYAEYTQMGTGLRVRFHQETPPVETAQAPGGDPVRDEEPPPLTDADSAGF